VTTLTEMFTIWFYYWGKIYSRGFPWKSCNFNRSCGL